MHRFASYYRLVGELERRRRQGVLFGLYGRGEKWDTAVAQHDLGQASGCFLLKSSSAFCIRATLTIAVYFALSSRVCKELCTQSKRTGYTFWFAHHLADIPTLLPMNQPCSREEVFDRYECLVPGCISLTAPYAPVACANWKVSSPLCTYQPLYVSLDDVAAAEARAVSIIHMEQWVDEDEVYFHLKHQRDDNEAEKEENAGICHLPVRNKLGYFCLALADIFSESLCHRLAEKRVEVQGDGAGILI